MTEKFRPKANVRMWSFLIGYTLGVMILAVLAAGSCP
jgi:hypothetical protein